MLEEFHEFLSECEEALVKEILADRDTFLILMGITLIAYSPIWLPLLWVMRRMFGKTVLPYDGRALLRNVLSYQAQLAVLERTVKEQIAQIEQFQKETQSILDGLNLEPKDKRTV